MTSPPPQDPYGQPPGGYDAPPPPPPYGAPPPPPPYDAPPGYGPPPYGGSPPYGGQPPYGPPPGYGSAPPPYGAPQPSYGTPPYQSPEPQAWAGPPLATWGDRALAWLIDYALLLGGLIVIFIVVGLLAALADPFGLLFLPAFLGIFAFDIWNRGVQVGKTGQSIGKKQMHIRALREADGQVLGVGQGVLRWFATFLLGICFVILLIDYLFPLWDPKRQTIHDKAVSSVVIKEP